MQPTAKRARLEIKTSPDEPPKTGAPSASAVPWTDVFPTAIQLKIATFLELADAHALRKTCRKFPKTAPPFETFVINDAAFGCEQPPINGDYNHLSWEMREGRRAKRERGADSKEQLVIKSLIANWSNTIVRRRSVRRLHIQGVYALCTPEIWHAALALFADAPGLREVTIEVEVVTSAAWKHFAHMIRGAVAAFLHVDTIRFIRPDDNSYGTDNVRYEDGQAPEAVFCETLQRLANHSRRPRWRRLELDRNLYRWASTGNDHEFVSLLPKDMLEVLDWNAALPSEHKLEKLHEYSGRIAFERNGRDETDWISPWKAIERNSGKWTKLELRQVWDHRETRLQSERTGSEILKHVAGDQLRHLCISGGGSSELILAEMRAILDKSPNITELSLPHSSCWSDDEKKASELRATCQSAFLKLIAESKCALKLRVLTAPFDVSQAPEEFTIALYKACSSLQTYPPWQQWVGFGKEQSQSPAVARALADPSRHGVLKRLALFASDDWSMDDVISVLKNSPTIDNLVVEKPLATKELIVWVGANLRHLTNLKIRATTETVITDELRYTIARNNPGLASQYVGHRSLYAVAPQTVQEGSGLCTVVQVAHVSRQQ